MRIAPPLLSVKGASARSSTKDRRKKRVYPNVIYEWKNFKHDVLANEFSGASTSKTQNPFGQSLSNCQSELNESNDASYLDRYVLTPLRELGLMRYRFESQGTFVYGQPDGVMLKNPSTQEQVAACCEFKATQDLLLPDDIGQITQDLLLPDDIGQIIEEYRKALGSQNQMEKCAQSRACHPIGQIVGYMVDKLPLPFGGGRRRRQATAYYACLVHRPKELFQSFGLRLKDGKRRRFTTHIKRASHMACKYAIDFSRRR
jgi:hypothetical protein